MNKLRRCTRILVVVSASAIFAGLIPAQAQQEQAIPGAQKLTLREAVTLALQNSRDLKLARMQYNVALDTAGVDRAAFLPNLYTGGGYVYTYGFPSVPGSGPPAVFELAYKESVFNPLLKGQQHADEDWARSQKVEVDRIRDDVMVRTASIYLELAEVRHLVSLMSNDQASADKILEITKERVVANQELPIEETRSELTSARIRERLIKLQDRSDNLLEQLRDLTGISENETIDLESGEAPSFATDLQSSQIADLAVQNDAGVKEAEDERSARQHLFRGAHLSYWPTADAVAQYSVYSRFNNYDLYYKTFQRNNFNIGVEVTIPIFAAKTSANVAYAKSQLNEAEVALSNKRAQARLVSTQQSRQTRELEATKEVARLDLKLAQQTLEVAQAKLEDGKATLKEVEQDRLDESDKWMQFLDANLAWQRGQLKVLQATGQLAKVLQP
jgi:outer membrane protein